MWFRKKEKQSKRTEIPIDRQYYIKLTDDKNTFEFKPISYEFDYDEKSDDNFFNNWVVVHCIVSYEGKVFSDNNPCWSVADIYEVNDITETINGINRLLLGETEQYHAIFFRPMFL